ncbi:uncharacterized protein LOC130744850 [Lotus japonicus]|uniref:uncharacterized protein LOC130744850 n=1 Tax=Lotus japonicus TaxID=34305 RepID=UPI002585D5CD|nr:uncharacterized protein LOC130744850 [Lotus japonicus]
MSKSPAREGGAHLGHDLQPIRIADSTINLFPLFMSLTIDQYRGWRRPERGVIKCNVDASFSPQTRNSAGGIVFRDDIGEVSGGAAKILYANSALGAEALILREATLMAANMDMQRVTFESDNKQVIEACTGRNLKGEIEQIIRDIRNWKINFPSWSFIWIPRTGNQSAHSIADLKKQRNLPPNWIWSPLLH